MFVKASKNITTRLEFLDLSLDYYFGFVLLLNVIYVLLQLFEHIYILDDCLFYYSFLYYSFLRPLLKKKCALNIWINDSRVCT